MFFNINLKSTKPYISWSQKKSQKNEKWQNAKINCHTVAVETATELGSHGNVQTNLIDDWSLASSSPNAKSLKSTPLWSVWKTICVIL